MCENSSQDSSDNPVLSQFEQEALLTEYREMREELRTNITILNQRVSRGIAAIGFVIGYSLLAPGGIVFISSVPVLIAVLLILSVQTVQEMAIVSRHAYDIEKLVPIDEFGWEHKYGGLINDNKRSIPWNRYERIDLMTLPLNVVITLSALLYFGFLYIGYSAIDQQVEAVGTIDPAILIFIFYTVLTFLLLIVGYSHITMMNSLQPDEK